MKKGAVFFVLVFALAYVLDGQSRKELEARQKAALDDINYVDNLIRNTANQKTQSLNDIEVLGKKIDIRETVIQSIVEDISMLNERIDINKTAIDLMESDIEILKKDYARAIVNSYKIKKSYPEIIYVLAAKDFNQGYKRVKFLQQFSNFRKIESENIVYVKNEIETSKSKLQDDLGRVTNLKVKQEQQKSMLLNEQNEKQDMVRVLTSKEKQLKKELESKKRIVEKIQSEITRLIEEERKSSRKSEVTPERKLDGDSFSENKGRLPWPVDKGVITSHFGLQKHPVLKYLTEENIGIEITGDKNMKVRSVFQGEVMRVFAISGANMTVIIRHGKFLTVYANLIDIKVKKGDKVGIRQEIGSVYSDESNKTAVLKFMIFETKYQDPEMWISKNREN